jgi:hypothetical protein
MRFSKKKQYINKLFVALLFFKWFDAFSFDINKLFNGFSNGKRN